MEKSPGKEKMMAAVIREHFLNLETIKEATLSQKEWSFGFAFAYKTGFTRKTVRKDVSLLE